MPSDYRPSPPHRGHPENDAEDSGEEFIGGRIGRWLFLSVVIALAAIPAAVGWLLGRRRRGE